MTHLKNHSSAVQVLGRYLSHNKSSPIKWRLPCITTTRRQSFSQMDSFSRGAHLTGYVRLPQANSGTGHHPPKYEI